jgi:hypothetical protein
LSHGAGRRRYSGMRRAARLQVGADYLP